MGCLVKSSAERVTPDAEPLQEANKTRQAIAWVEREIEVISAAFAWIVDHLDEQPK